MSVLKKISNVPFIVRQIGIWQSVHVCSIYLLEPHVMKVIPIYASLIKKTRVMGKMLNVRRDFTYLRSRKSDLVSAPNNAMDIAELGLSEHGHHVLEEELKTTNKVVIATIDQDGYYLSLFGPIDGIPCVDETGFIPRVRFSLDLVTVDRKVGVRKDYGGCKLSFIREIEALCVLRRAGCNVPSILDVDFDKCWLTISYIPGAVLREQLALKGAPLRDRDVDEHSSFSQISAEARDLERIKRGQHYIPEVLDHDFIENLFDQIVKIHQTGFLIRDIKYGNIIIEKKTGEPYLIDFESAFNFCGMGHRVFRQLRDHDIEKFNLHFGTDKPTYQRLRQKILHEEFLSQAQGCSPWYISPGLRVGEFWNPERGWGLWHAVLKDNLPGLTGKRVLDLKADNAYLSLQVLKNGASAVIGFETDPACIQQGLFLKSAMEWSDNRKYDFRYIQSGMMSLKTMDLGHFDLVMALGSLHVPGKDELCELVRHISSITDCFAVHFNTAQDTGKDSSRAPAELMRHILEENGFPLVRNVAPQYYPHPLLLGRKYRTDDS